MTMHRAADERNAKWGHIAEVTHGQLCVVVLGKLNGLRNRLSFYDEHYGTLSAIWDTIYRCDTRLNSEETYGT